MSSRYIPHNGQNIPFDVERYINDSLVTLLTEFPPDIATFDESKATTKASDPESPKFCRGLFGGPDSIAYVLYHMGQSWPPVLGKPLVEWSKAYYDVAERMNTNTRVDSNFCGHINQRTSHSALRAVILRDRKGVDELLSYVPGVLAPPPKLEEVGGDEFKTKEYDEMVYGRAGFLHLLRLARHHWPEVKELEEAIHSVIEVILQRNPDSEHPWDFVGAPYLGPAHGWSGTLAQVLLSDRSPGRAKQCRPWVLDMLEMQKGDGNWGKLARNDQGPDLVQIGHGAPGMVVALGSMRAAYQGDEEMEEKIDKAIERAQEVIWEKGLVKKQNCILHGAAGNSLALLDHARRATFLAHGANEKEMIDKGEIEASSDPSGLQRGFSGAIWAAWAHHQGMFGKYIAFNEV